jgi:hypothetical protein
MSRALGLLCEIIAVVIWCFLATYRDDRRATGKGE